MYAPLFACAVLRPPADCHHPQRATLKRPAYFESDAESASAATAESDSDDAFAPVSASKANGRGKAGPAAKKARGRADDDWLVDDDDSESAALTDASGEWPELPWRRSR
jgi:hypothetical protein